jgi:hypothetical protein
VADLRVEDATLKAAQATFRKASARLEPVVRALKVLNAEVVGADPLTECLHEAHGILSAELGIIGQALAELAADTGAANTSFGQVDQALGQQVQQAPR